MGQSSIAPLQPSALCPTSLASRSPCRTLITSSTYRANGFLTWSHPPPAIQTGVRLTQKSATTTATLWTTRAPFHLVVLIKWCSSALRVDWGQSIFELGGRV